MMTLEQCKEIFIEKLKSTGDMDAAFGKAIWIAYNRGLIDGMNDARSDKTKVIERAEHIVTEALCKVQLTHSTINPPIERVK